MGHQADRARESDGPNHKGLSDTVGGTLELGCNPKRRTLRNQTNIDDTLEALVKGSHIRQVNTE